LVEFILRALRHRDLSSMIKRFGFASRVELVCLVAASLLSFVFWIVAIACMLGASNRFPFSQADCISTLSLDQWTALLWPTTLIAQWALLVVVLFIAMVLGHYSRRNFVEVEGQMNQGDIKDEDGMG